MSRKTEPHFIRFHMAIATFACCSSEDYILLDRHVFEIITGDEPRRYGKSTLTSLTVMIVREGRNFTDFLEVI
jgi:hypothetical protein